MELDKRQTAIVLASLRIAQRGIGALNHMPHFEELLGPDAGPVTEEEIDGLCEEINRGEFPARRGPAGASPRPGRGRSR